MSATLSPCHGPPAILTLQDDDVCRDSHFIHRPTLFSLFAMYRRHPIGEIVAFLVKSLTLIPGKGRESQK
jgi:hypothetical protein